MKLKSLRKIEEAGMSKEAKEKATSELNKAQNDVADVCRSHSRT